jgi:hypothetical protein
MNNKSAWNKKFLVFLDPLIKQLDLDLFNCIHSQLDKLNFSITSNVEETLNHNDLKSIFIINQTRRQSDPVLFNDSSKSIFIEFLNANMSLFESSRDDLQIDYHLQFKDEKDFNNCLSILSYYLSSLTKKFEDDLFKKSEIVLKQISQIKTLNENPLKGQDLLLIEKIEQDIYSATDFSELIETLDNIDKVHDYTLKINPPYEVNLEQEYLPLKFENQLYFLTFDHNSPSKYLLAYIYQIIYMALIRLESKKTNIEILENLEQIFTQISIPIVVFDKDQQLILHNELFINLNISAKKCFSLEANEQITINNNIFKVQKIKIKDVEHIQLNFIPVNEVLGSRENPTSEELGIVTSSIAHELNNPLAGILAALTVLEMDEYPIDIMEKFTQMRKSVLRCKTLVETFLGFSKVQGGTVSSTMNLEESFNQAVELTRFRLIENNITIHFNYKVMSKMNSAINGHIMSMIYYLFLGELLTSFSHQNLVELKNSQKIEGIVSENSDHLEFLLPENITLSESFFKSKLISHLLESQKFQVEVIKNKCTFFL